MESLARDHMVAHMMDNGLFTSFEHGFIKGRTCATNLLAVLNAWNDAFDTRYAVDAVYLNFAKAFDTVQHEHLLTKGYGIQDKVLWWIQELPAR